MMSGDHRASDEVPPRPAERLESWKEIAAYLRRGVRTVRRWEKEEGLPVHRQLHKTLGTVYAHPHEIDAWRQSRHAGTRSVRARPHSGPSRSRIMLAVLPFEDLSRDPEKTYFGDGLTDEMISRLGRLRPETLGVIARTTVMQYKGATKTVRQIGDELGVEHVLEGTVRHEAGRVRITAQLIQVKDQTQLWAGQYEQATSRILALQRELAAEIGGRIHFTLSPQALGEPAAARRIDPEAYLAWLKGRHFLNRLTTESVRRSVEHFRHALAIEPAYAAAHASLAEAYAHTPMWIELPTAEVLPLAINSARAALALDPDLAEAYSSLGLAHANYVWDWSAAERYFERALELNPGCVPAGQWYAEFLAEMGRGDEALAIIDRTATHDPLSPGIQASAAFVLWLDRRNDEALARVERALEMDPHYAMALIRRGVVYVVMGLYDEAAEAFRAARTATPDLLTCTSLLGHACARAGRTDEALAQLEKLRRHAATRHVPDFLFANVHLALGDELEALRLIELEWEARGWYMLLLNRSPLYDSLRLHPRFQDLLRRMNFAGVS